MATETQGQRIPLASTLRDTYKKALDKMKKERERKVQMAINDIREQITQAALEGRNLISFHPSLYSQELQDWADKEGFKLNTESITDRRYKGMATLSFEI